jgi:uncharacterized membrane protein YdjX (TVP38/TMEM64 family)
MNASLKLRALSQYKFMLAVLFIVLIVAGGLWFWGDDRIPTNAEDFTDLFKRFESAGPLLIVGMLAAAIVFSPLPSAPIALAAGAVYGHTWGTIYVVIGAELGALIAFTLARWIAHDTISRLLEGRAAYNLIGSQNALTVTVFVTRLMPFISFDLVSYAAGLTRITTIRFALATLGGIIPASFFLAHFGDELTSADAHRVGFGVLILGLLVVVFFLINLRRGRQQAGSCENKK